jgi:acyl-CoA thioester hydrolase
VKENVTSFRVRYPEVDRMGVAHHTHFLVWFELGRTELLRSLGCTYGEMESSGVFMPVVEVACRYRAPVRYDDLLEVETRLGEVSGSRVTFEYILRKQGQTKIMAEARTVHAAVDRDGQVIRLPAPYRELLVRP